MKSIRILVLGMAGLAGALGGCGRNDAVLAGGTEQPNEIVGRVLDGRNEPSPSAHVSLWSGNFNPGDSSLTLDTSSLLAETWTDSAGKFDLRKAYTVPFFLEVHSRDSSGMAIVTPMLENPIRLLRLDSTRLLSSSGLRGTLHPSNPKVFSLALAGTHYKARVTDSGTFRFPRVLPGRYALLAEVLREGGPTVLALDSLILPPGSVVDLDSLLPPLDSMPLFSFEEPAFRSDLRGILFPRGSSNGGRMQIDWKLVSSIPMEDQAAELSLWPQGSYRGKSLRIRMKANTEYAFNLGQGHYDFTQVDTLVFYARTVGDSLPISVLLHTEAVPNGAPSFHARTTLPSQWSRIAVSQDAIRREPRPDSTLSWDQARAAVARISLVSSRDAEVWIDDIHLVGLSYADLVRK